MTLPTSTRVTDPYETDGVQRDFEFDFPAFYNADTGHYGIEVRRLTALDYEVIDKSLYDIFLNDEDKSGYIRFHVAPMAGDDIYIAGDTTRSQQLNLINYGRYSAQSIEKAFDLIVALIQEFVSKVDEETRQRILADQALRDFLLIKFNQFTAEVTTKIDKHIGDINGFMSSLIPMFVCIMRKELAYYIETQLDSIIDAKLSDLSTQVANAIAENDAALIRLNESILKIEAATTATAIGARLFDTPAAGVHPVTGVPVGSYFNVRSPNAESYVDEYQNVGGSAVATGKRYLSSLGAQLQEKAASTIKDASGKDQQEVNNSLKNREIYVDDYFAGSGSLRPVSDLYTVGSSVYDKRFTTLASVQSVLTAATAANDPLDWAAIQTCVDNFRAVNLSAKFYYIGTKVIELPTNCIYMKGKGDLTRIYATGLKAIKAKDGQRIVHGRYGGFYLLGSSVTGSIGFDASGFSYNTIEDIYIRQFTDGWYADGSTSPVNKQYSNNTIINVRSNNNLDRGFKFVGSSEANSANTYIGCEGAGNFRGFDEQVGYSNQAVGCTFQGNTELDFFTNGQRNTYQFYTEGKPKSVKLGSLSRNSKIDVRSSYPLWNTCIDEGKENTKSVRGDLSSDTHVFHNPYFENWTGANPANLLPNGSVTLSWFADSTLPKGGGLQATFNADFQGLILSGLDPSIDYAGRWITVQIEADTSGITDLSGLRIYTRDGSTNNNTSGALALDSWTKTAVGKYKNFTYDVKFADSVAGLPSILIYLAYSGITTTNTIKIKAIKVILGQKDRVSEYALSAKPATSVGVNFTSASSGLNTAWKSSARFVTNTTSGKVYYPSGSSPTSPWKALDGSSDIVPA